MQPSEKVAALKHCRCVSVMSSVKPLCHQSGMAQPQRSARRIIPGWKSFISARPAQVAMLPFIRRNFADFRPTTALAPPEVTLAQRRGLRTAG
jgi:hypothetical protein